MRATVRTLNENGQHALTTVRRACPARLPRTPPLAIAGGPRLLLMGSNQRAHQRARQWEQRAGQRRLDDGASVPLNSAPSSKFDV